MNGPAQPEQPFPPELLAAAERVGNGELYWSSDGVEQAARWLARHGFAVVGGELYRRHEGAWATYVGGWSTAPVRGVGESWPDYAHRGSRQALAFIAKSGDDRGLMFFLAFCSEQEYETGASVTSRRGTGRPSGDAESLDRGALTFIRLDHEEGRPAASPAPPS